METTLCYVEHDGAYLMLHRISKKNDVSHGKWIGVGGKFEYGESPEECLRREVYEETGLVPTEWQYRGIATFVSDRAETEYMHLFTITGFEGEPHPCDEGTLEWVPCDEMNSLPHWTGDEIFLHLLRDADRPFFSLKLVYEGDTLVQAKLNDRRCLVTDRLILRPWLYEDADQLFELASDPEVGPPGGWLPHADAEESRRVLDDILMEDDIFAIVRRDESDIIGCIGLAPTKTDNEPELGYWLGHSYWGQGFATEAARCVLDYAFTVLGTPQVHASYYEGNERSRHVLDKCGFRRMSVLDNEPVPLLGQTRTAVHCVLSR